MGGKQALRGVCNIFQVYLPNIFHIEALVREELHPPYWSVDDCFLRAKKQPLDYVFAGIRVFLRFEQTHLN